MNTRVTSQSSQSQRRGRVRQLHRVLKSCIGLSPQEFLKLLRLQRSLRTHYLDVYADQSHFIHAFRDATGYTPQRYRSAFRG